MGLGRGSSTRCYPETEGKEAQDPVLSDTKGPLAERREGRCERITARPIVCRRDDPRCQDKVTRHSASPRTWSPDRHGASRAPKLDAQGCDGRVARTVLRQPSLHRCSFLTLDLMDPDELDLFRSSPDVEKMPRRRGDIDLKVMARPLFPPVPARCTLTPRSSLHLKTDGLAARTLAS